MKKFGPPGPDVKPPKDDKQKDRDKDKKKDDRAAALGGTYWANAAGVGPPSLPEPRIPPRWLARRARELL